MEDDEIKAVGEFSRQLSLYCGQGAFARIRDLVLAEAKIEGADRDKINCLHIIEFPASRRRSQKAHARDRFALIGCGLVAAFMIAVIWAGIVTIWGWIKANVM
jgi:hypothetical protein